MKNILKLKTKAANTVKDNFWTIERITDYRLNFLEHPLKRESLKQLPPKFEKDVIKKIENNTLFDFEYFPINNDKLKITNIDNKKSLTYCLKFQDNRWISYIDALDWMEEEIVGKRYQIIYCGEIVFSNSLY